MVKRMKVFLSASLTAVMVFFSVPILPAEVYALSFGTSSGSTLLNRLSSSTEVVVDPGLTLSEAGNLDGATVVINNCSSGDTLNFTNQNGISGSYNSTNGKLTLSGSATYANYQTALRSVTFSTSSSDRTDRAISFSIGTAVYSSYTEHFYEYISGSFTWTEAKSAAAGRNYLGRTGYLATITSAVENEFIKAKLGSDAWIGASDDWQEIKNSSGQSIYSSQASAEGNWYWVTGPDSGTQFSQYNLTPAAINSRYMNWNGSEPNNSGSNEHYGEIYVGGSSQGKWNDLPNSSRLGYVVEYGGYSGEAAISASKTITIYTVPDVPTSVSASAGNQQATISFLAPANNGGSAITQYRVTSNTGGFSATGTGSPITVTGLVEGTSYTFTVTATNSVGTGSASAASNSVTPYTLKRVTYTSTSDASGSVPVDSISYIPGSIVTVQGNTGTLARTGYSFAGWSNGSTTYQAGNTFSISDNITLAALWTARTDTPYKIMHYLMPVDGTAHVVDEALTESLTGTTASFVSTTGHVKDITGFTRNKSLGTSSTTLAADGSTVLSIYYDRVEYAVRFNDFDGQEIVTQKVRYGADATSPTQPSRTGYDFSSWNGTYTAITGDTVITAVYTPKTDTTYKVEHYLQTLDGSAYSLQETESLKGTTDTTAYAVAKSYTGFHENSSAQGRIASGSISGTGSAILKIYYDRDIYTVKFDPDNGSASTEQTIRFQADASPPAAPLKTGYTFSSWSGTYTNITSDRTITASYTANTNTAYQVDYYLQDITGDGYALANSASYPQLVGKINLTGTTLSEVTAPEPYFAGFSENTSHGSRVVQGSIQPDDSLVLKRYYDRLTYTVEFFDRDNQLLKSEVVRYGGSATPPEPPAEDGYDFSQWDGSYTEVKSELDLDASYTPHTDTPYYINYYLQDVTGDGYTLANSSTYSQIEGLTSLLGTTDSTATAPTPSFAGFTENTTTINRLVVEKIAGDGSLILKRYYDRIPVTITYLDYDGTTLKTEPLRYGGSSSSAPTDPTRTGYTFDSWVGNQANLTSDSTVRAAYAPNRDTAYLVRHYQEKVDGTGYDLVDTDSKQGITDTLATASPDTFTGFSYESSKSSASGNINADGSRVLSLYYDRDLFTVAFVDYNAAALSLYSVRYGADSPVPAAPTRVGYTFSSWNGTKTNIQSDQTVTAIYTANTNTAYQVEHYLQNLNGDEYLLTDTDAFTGTTDTIARANIRTYTGFVENLTQSSRLPTGTLAADGSLVLKRYYDRKLYTVSFEIDNALSKSESVRFLGSATPPETRKSRYSFSGWRGSWTNITANQVVTGTYTLMPVPVEFSELTVMTIMNPTGSSNLSPGQNTLPEVKPAVLEPQSIQLIQVPEAWRLDATGVSIYLQQTQISTKPQPQQQTDPILQAAESSLNQANYRLLDTYNLELYKVITSSNGAKTETLIPNSDLLGNITVRIPVPAELYDLRGLTIVFISDTGQVALLPTSRITVNGQDYLEFANNHFSYYGIIAQGRSSRAGPITIRDIPATGEPDHFVLGLVFIGISLLLLAWLTIKPLYSHTQS